MGLETGPLGLLNTNEELLGRRSRGSGLGNREYGRRDPSRWPRDTLYPQKCELSSPTSGGCSIGIVSSRTQVTEFSFPIQIQCSVSLNRGPAQFKPLPFQCNSYESRWALIYMSQVGCESMVAVFELWRTVMTWWSDGYRCWHVLL
jgi:hypothetical protein